MHKFYSGGMGHGVKGDTVCTDMIRLIWVMTCHKKLDHLI